MSPIYIHNMPKRRSYRLIKPRALLFILILLAVLLIVTGVMEYSARRRSVLQLMATMSASLCEIVQKSAVNAILSYDLLEDAAFDRLISSLQSLDFYVARDSISPQDVATTIARMNCDYCEIYTSRGVLIYPPDSVPILSNPRKAFEQAASGPVTGYWRHPLNDKQYYGVLSQSRNGRLLAAYIDGTYLKNVRKSIGIGSLLNSLTRDTALTYIAIQDSLGIIAATERIDTLSSINSDAFINQVLQKRQFAWRLTQFHNEPIFEGALPFMVGSVSYGVIRIGLNSDPLHQIMEAAIRQVILRLGVLLAVGFVILVYGIALQNVHLLETEKEKITGEVVRLQADLRQKEKLSAMGELAAGVAHEIRNPLNAISMTIQLLERESTSSQTWSQQLTLVRREVGRIQQIIQDFLTFARPAPLNRQRVDVGEIIDKVVQTYQARAAGRNVTITWQKPNDVTANLDGTKLSTCIANLLDNALDATPIGGHIVINLHRRHHTTYISISDDGVGIESAHLPKIFNLYFTTKPNGTGLGLAQVYQIVSEHNGTIEVESRPGSGTTFKLQLPD